MKLTKAHQDAGIVQILCENYNGSYTCLVDITKVDLDNTDANPRRHSDAHDNRINARYDRRSVRNPVLRYANGKLITCEGRHTTSVHLNLRNEKYLTCEVHFNITNAQAAAIFFNLTVNSKRIAPWDAHVCGVQAGFPWATKIETMLNAYRLSSPNSVGFNSKNADVRCYTPLQEAYDASNGCLEKVCYLLDQTYRDTTSRVDRHAKDVAFLRGLIDLIESEDYKSYSASALAARLGRRTAGWVYDRALEYLKESYTSTRPDRSHYLLALRDVMDIPDKRAA